MAVEQRNGREYYYRKHRYGNRVVSQYLRRNPEEMRQEAELIRLRKESRVWFAEWDKGLRPCETVCRQGIEAVGELLKRALALHGYHCHHSEWRRSSMRMSLQEYFDLSDEEREALPEDDQEELFQASHKWYVLTRETLLGRALDMVVLYASSRNGDREQEESRYKILLEDLRKNLGYDTAPELEKLLIYAIELAVVNFDMVARACAKSHDYSALVACQTTNMEKRLSMAQRRYLKAIETLAKVRKMRLPNIQVNIGRNQINTLSG